MPLDSTTIRMKNGAVTTITWRGVVLAAATGPDFPSGNRYDRSSTPAMP
ncbi:hypothetical protein [Kitasatospora sp. NBC_01539]